MSLADKIKMLRLKKGLSQAQLADALGVSRQAEAKWESGTTAPDILKIKDIASLLGTTADALLSEDPVEEIPHQSPAESKKVTLRMAEQEQDEVSAFMAALGYQPVKETAEGGALILLNPLSFLEIKDPLPMISLSYALPLEEVANKDKARLRKEFFSGPTFEEPFARAKAAYETLENHHHPGRGIVYVIFSALDIPCIALTFTLVGYSRWFYLLVALTILLFPFLLVQGIRWIKKPSPKTYPKDYAAYERAKNELAADAKANQEIYRNALLLIKKDAPAPSDPLERISKAKALLDQGALTQEEFEAIKKKALSEEK